MRVYDKILIEGEKVLMRWKEYFEDILLSGKTTSMNRNTYYTAEPKDISPTLEDVSYVIMSLKNHTLQACLLYTSRCV